MPSNNYRVAIWSDIRNAVARRMTENTVRLAQCPENNPDLRATLERIAKDDAVRMKTANELIAFHRR